jgi:N-acetylglucosamine transport system substrate-binding protein
MSESPYDAGPGPARRAVLLGAVSAALVAAGCSDDPPVVNETGPPSADNPFGVEADVPLDVVTGAGPTAYGLVEYRRRHPRSAAKVTPIEQLRRALEPRLAGGNPPDAVHNTGPQRLNAGRLVTEGRLADLGSLLEAPSWPVPARKVRETITPGVVEAGSYDGVLRELPYLNTVYAFWYSAALFEKRGWTVPRTWPELLTLATKMKAAGLPPFVHAGKHPFYISEAMLTLAAKTGGIETLKNIDNLEDGAWQDESVTEAVTAFHELRAKGFVLEGSDDLDHIRSQTRFVRSQTGLLPCGNWLDNEMRSVTPKGFGLTAFAIPPLDGSAKLPNGVHVTPGEAFLVPEQAKNRPGGLEFVRAMLSRDVAAQYSKRTNSLTVVRGVTYGVEYTSALRSAAEIVTTAGDQTIDWFFARWYPRLGQAVESATGALMAGAVTVPEWTNRIQRTADEVKRDRSIRKFHRGG